jgi:tetratricopeptide (TPR) repeat protein
MKRWHGYTLLALLLGAGWWWFASTAAAIQELADKIEMLREAGDPEEQVAALASQLTGMEGSRMIQAILLFFLGAALLGVVFVLDVLPIIAHKATHAIYDSDEIIERDVMRDARSFYARGDYESAVEAYREAAAADPTNRFPWVEIAKIQKDHLHHPEAAIATMSEALARHEWGEDDQAFFLFRQADLYAESMGDPAAALSVLDEVEQRFPETRHAASARHKRGEWEPRARVPDAPETAAEPPQP